MRRARFMALALVLFACRHHDTPTSPTSSVCRSVMGALTNATLTGRVLFSDGRTAAGARIRFEDIERQYQYTAKADGNGSFRAVDALWSETPYTTFVYAPDESQPAATSVTVLACHDNVRDFVIPATRCTYVTGTVRGKPYSTVEGARLSFAGVTTTTMNDSTYVLKIGCPPLFAGSPSTLTVSHPEYKPYSAAVTIPETSMSLDVTLVPK